MDYYFCTILYSRLSLSLLINVKVFYSSMKFTDNYFLIFFIGIEYIKRKINEFKRNFRENFHLILTFNKHIV